jgi:hypothetical protein
VTRGSGVHRGGILRHRAVRWLWSASACAAVAVWSVQIAVTVQVLEHHSVATLALVGLVGSVPALVLLPVAGISADRYDVRRLALPAVPHHQVGGAADRSAAVPHGPPRTSTTATDVFS